MSIIFSHIDIADGRVWMLPKGVACFAGDLSEADQKVVWATHAAPAADLFNQKVEGTARKSKPSWYTVAKNDPPSNPSRSASWRSGWALRSTRSTAATSPCSRTPAS